MDSVEQQTFAEPLTVTDTIQIPWSDVLRLVTSELRARGQGGGAGSRVEGIAEDVRCRVAGPVAHEVAERERHSEALHQHLENLLHARLRERLRQSHGRIVGDPKRRREVLAEVCRAVAEAAHGELTRWLRDHIGAAIRDDLGAVLRDRLDEALRVPALRERLAAANGHRGDLLVLVREHLVERLCEHLAEDAGRAVAERLEPRIKEALRARLAAVFDDAAFDARVEDLARSDGEPFAAAVAAMAADLGRDALDQPLQETIRQYLDGMFSGRAQIFRDEIGRLLAPGGGEPAAGELGEVVCAAERGIERLVRDRIDQALRDRLAPLLRRRIQDALALAVSTSGFGFDLGLRADDLDRLAGDIWERWGYVFREHLGRALGERMTALVGRRVAEAIRAALSPSVLDLAEMTRAPALPSSTARPAPAAPPPVF